MTAIHVTHLDNSRYRVVTGRHSLTIDQPVTSGGDDSGPSPVELFAASLAACVAHYAGSYLDRHGLSSEGLAIDADFAMADDRPARIASLSVTITPPAGLSESRKAGLLAVASHCTVHNTIHQPPSVDINLSDRPAAGATSSASETVERPDRPSPVAPAESRAARGQGEGPNPSTGSRTCGTAELVVLPRPCNTPFTAGNRIGTWPP
jgi:putative redox protein